MNQHKDKKVEEILEEFKNILDSITKQNKQDNKNLQEDLKKIEELKNTLKVEHKTTTQSSSVTVNSNQEISSGSVDVVKEIDAKEKVIKEETKEKKEIISDKQVSQVPTESEVKEDRVLINVMLLFPSVLQDAKNLFFDNINSTLKRVSKKNVEVVEKINIGYESLTRDIFLQYNSIIEKISKHGIHLLILIVNEKTFEIEDFIKKVSSFVLLTRIIDVKELRLKSTYLDLSIDLLLNVK